MGWIVGAAGLVMQGVGGASSAQASERQAQGELLAAEGEALQLEDNAKQTVAAGSFNSDRIKKKLDKILGSQRAQMAAGGGDTTDGSFMDVQADSVKEASIDQLLAMSAAEDDARKDRFQAKATRYSGVINSNAASNRAKAETIRGTGTLLLGAGDWAQKYG
jgi:hypothetical protein